MGKAHFNKEFWVAGLRAEGVAFRAAVGQEDVLTAPVPSCPDWTVEDLVRHLASLYRWVTGHVGRGVTDNPDAMDSSGSPTGRAVLGWWDEQYAELLKTLDWLDPALPAWNPAPQSKRAEFWHRRMAHETAVHRWDAQMAVGLAEPVEAKLAADGVTEVLDTLLPMGRRRGPTDRYGVVALRATDLGGVWDVRLRGEGIALLDTDTLLDHDHHNERVVASGTASDLLLALYGRVPFDILDIVGDESLLTALLTA
ncbi:maleylpyruvate isomerase family mycothiol-dependent enzyme [Planosporangium thailandense]|uniref:Maleylpyruvate isomerase family mycothiol-dependent enzyme n=1 Tax=Planosporangium thailandense TaxID=765197 RepID=A0ABX0XTI5_9ACTN|nr:maleylpyruvate isomerase family mycothiol-dependent enzyme [Planosporangium thailandense]NJC69298.1 maleylpyruvate isomerase family mycothiol-dependent enzyme [Planosporangium thailandense]